MLAVLITLITAPLGALAISISGPVLLTGNLEKSRPANYDAENLAFTETSLRSNEEEKNDIKNLRKYDDTSENRTSNSEITAF